MNTFECRTTRYCWILNYIPYFMTHTVQFSSLYIFWPEYGPAQRPKHVFILIIKKTKYRQLCFDLLNFFPLLHIFSEPFLICVFNYLKCCTTSSKIIKICIFLSHCVCAFLMVITVISDNFPKQHQTILSLGIPVLYVTMR